MTDLLRTRILAVAVLIVAFAMTACTSTEVVSNKDPGYDRNIESLYIFSEVSEELEKLEMVSMQRMLMTLKTGQVDVEIKHLDHDEDEPSLEEKSDKDGISFETAREFGATQVLKFTETDRTEVKRGAMMNHSTGMMTGSGTDQTYEFDASLYDATTEKRIWRATVTTEGTEMTAQSAEGRTLAKKLIEQLVEDGLLPASVLEAMQAS
jgi:DNA-directed RNA polymerase specialized sigma54-like protein